MCQTTVPDGKGGKITVGGHIMDYLPTSNDDPYKQQRIQMDNNEAAMVASRGSMQSHIGGLDAGAANRAQWKDQFSKEYGDDLSDAFGQAKFAAFQDYKKKGLITSKESAALRGQLQGDKTTEDARLQNLSAAFSTGTQAQESMAQRRQRLLDEDPVEYNISGGPKDYGRMATQYATAGAEYDQYRPETGTLSKLDMTKTTTPNFFSNYDLRGTPNVGASTLTGQNTRSQAGTGRKGGFPDRLTVKDPLSSGSLKTIGS